MNVIIWGKRFDESEPNQTCYCSLDGVDIAILEPKPFSSKWFSHKFHGAGLRYEVGLNIRTGHIVWINGGYPCGDYSDITIARTKILWKLVLENVAAHVFLCYSFYLIMTGQVAAISIVFAVAAAIATNFGYLGGGHRLWSHKSYKAKWKLRMVLMLLQSMGTIHTIHKWAREHRAHHKFVETDADPFNPARGLFFAHIGWIMLEKHPDAVEKGKLIDISDIEADPIVMFQKRHFRLLVLVMALIIPTAFHYCVLGDPFINALFIGTVFRFLLSIHLVGSINSFAHHFGARPYDKNLLASNNTLIGIISSGEGWHNFHHAFPWDYRNSELGNFHLNINCALIDFFAKIGWAYDLKTASDEIIIKRALRTGDGSLYKYTKLLDDKNPLYRKLRDLRSENEPNKDTVIWGWGDEELDPFDKEHATILHAEKFYD